MRKRIGLLLLTMVVAAGWMKAQVPNILPLTQQEVMDILKGKGGEQQAAMEIIQRGVDFEMNPDIEKKLRKVMPDDAFIELVKKAGPQARAARAKEGGLVAGSPAEMQVFRKIQNELVPDKALQMIAEFLKAYPKSRLLTYAYWFGANALEQKGDLPQALTYLDKSLELSPDNIPSLTLKASLLPQPQLLKVSDDVKGKRLDEAEELAGKALKLIDQIPKNAQETDEMLAKRKALLGSGAHAALGLTHLQRAGMSLEGLDKAELAKAETEYRAAVSTIDNPTPEDYYRLGETLLMENKQPEALAAFMKASELSDGTPLKPYVDQKIEQIKKANPAVRPAAQP